MSVMCTMYMSSPCGGHKRAQDSAGGKEVLVHERRQRGARNVKHTGFFLERKGCRTCYPLTRLGTNVVNSVLLFVLSVWPRTHPILPNLYDEFASLFLVNL